MNHDAWKSLDRALAQLERRDRRSRRRVSTAPFVLAVGLGLGYLLLVRLVPEVWPALLASEPGASLHGWPLLVWRAAEFCHGRQPAVLTGVVAVSVLGLVLSLWLRPLRPVTWLAAVLVVFADAGIIVVTVLACLQAAQVGV
jgi:hypothetical protein